MNKLFQTTLLLVFMLATGVSAQSVLTLPQAIELARLQSVDAAAALNELKMFRISKIYIYESNSQRQNPSANHPLGCSEYQRYTFMKAIHNHIFILGINE